MDLKSQLASLFQVQELDTQIYALKRQKESAPEELHALDARFEEKKAALVNAEKLALDFQKQKKERELDFGSKEESGKKLQGQLYALKTNKEYQTMMQQIADAKADASVIEDKILELMEKIEVAKVTVEEQKKILQQEEKVFAQLKQEIQDRVKGIDDQIAQLDAKRRQACSSVDVKIFAQYERILASRDALAIVEAAGNSCKGCHMYVPPQVINMIKMYDQVITCEVCNRMLYIKEDMDSV